MIQKYQIYKLPSGEVVKVGVVAMGTTDDWNCIYQSPGRRGAQISLSGAFLRKFGEVWA